MSVSAFDELSANLHSDSHDWAVVVMGYSPMAGLRCHFICMLKKQQLQNWIVLSDKCHDQGSHHKTAYHYNWSGWNNKKNIEADIQKNRLHCTV